jgi:hypothetical protein
MMPILTDHVKIEAGFESFSTLLVVSMPVAIWCYLGSHSAVGVFGLIKSTNIVDKQRLLLRPTRAKDEPLEQTQSARGNFKTR